jgi:hypothetical protein
MDLTRSSSVYGSRPNGVVEMYLVFLQCGCALTYSHYWINQFRKAL